MDRYQQLRELPFVVVAQALGIDAAKFRPRKGGSEWSGPCPVHNGKRSNTAFSYNVDGAWHCFSCSAKGKGAIDLCMAIRKLGFQEAVRVLEPYAGAAIVAQAPKVIPATRTAQEPVTENPPFRSTYGKYFKPHPWLEERGISPATLERYGSGYYENPARKSTYNGSLLLKISRYSDGECVGYLSRNVGEITADKPKYRFPEGLVKSLEVFGAWELKEDNRLPLRIVYAVESPLCVMAFHQKGIPAISCYGWTISPQQADIISQIAKGCVFLPDRDKWEEANPSALIRKMWVKMPPIPDGVDDPEYLTREQVLALTS